MATPLISSIDKINMLVMNNTQRRSKTNSQSAPDCKSIASHFRGRKYKKQAKLKANEILYIKLTKSINIKAIIAN